MRSKSITHYIIAFVVLGGIALLILMQEGGIFSSKTPANTEEGSRAATAYTSTRVAEGGRYVTVVSYTHSGFNPSIVKIKRGEAVRFVNKSSLPMRIASNEFQNIPIYHGFNQEKSVGLNGTYELSFTTPGVWGYHNLNGDPAQIGIVYVE